MVITVPVEEYIMTNAYFYVDDEHRRGFLIDPGAQADKLMAAIEKHGITVEKILLTHGHFDHMGAVNDLKEKLGVPVLMRRAGQEYVTDPAQNLSAVTGDDIVIKNVSFVDDYAEIFSTEGNSFGVKVLPLAGHTTDGAVYYAEGDNLAFVGDSIFKGSYGRTDLFGGDERTLLTNIINIIFSLPDDTTLYSGHSEPTSVGKEKNSPMWQHIKKILTEN